MGARSLEHGLIYHTGKISSNQLEKLLQSFLDEEDQKEREAFPDCVWARHKVSMGLHLCVNSTGALQYCYVYVNWLSDKYISK